jgi:hypothetical protein
VILPDFVLIEDDNDISKAATISSPLGSVDNQRASAG